MKMNSETLLQAYRQLRTIRDFEERIHKEFATGEISGFGIQDIKVDGRDYFSVYGAAKEALETIRAGKGPRFIANEFTRFYGHFKGDGATYRPVGMVSDEGSFLDILKFFGARVTTGELLTNEELVAIDAEVEALIDEAKASRLSSIDQLTTDVHANY